MYNGDTGEPYCWALGNPLLEIAGFQICAGHHLLHSLGKWNHEKHDYAYGNGLMRPQEGMALANQNFDRAQQKFPSGQAGNIGAASASDSVDMINPFLRAVVVRSIRMVHKHEKHAGYNRYWNLNVPIPEDVPVPEDEGIAASENAFMGSAVDVAYPAFRMSPPPYPPPAARGRSSDTGQRSDDSIRANSDARPLKRGSFTAAAASAAAVAASPKRVMAPPDGGWTSGLRLPSRSSTRTRTPPPALPAVPRTLQDQSRSRANSTTSASSGSGAPFNAFGARPSSIVQGRRNPYNDPGPDDVPHQSGRNRREDKQMSWLAAQNNAGTHDNGNKNAFNTLCCFGRKQQKYIQKAQHECQRICL